MKKLIHFVCIVIIVGSNLFLQSCKDDEDSGSPIASIFYSVVNKQVAFTALTKRADTWNWNFGDGETSTEESPVHVYAEGGTYTVTLTASGNGQSVEATTKISLALSNLEMLTGGAKATGGKTWRISSSHSSYDRFALADDNFTSVQAISAGLLGNLGLGLGEVYDDLFTFKADGTYIHSPQHNGAFAGLVYASLTGAKILNVTSTSKSFGLCYAAYTPESNATYTFNEKKDFSITTVSTNGKTATDRTYSGVMTLSFSGTEFIGFMDFTRDCIVQNLTNDTMRLVIFVSTTTGSYYNKPSYVVILTFEAVE